MRKKFPVARTAATVGAAAARPAGTVRGAKTTCGARWPW